MKKSKKDKKVQMILSTEKEIILQKSYDKILYLHPAINNTFVSLACRTYNKEVFVHCNRHGKILF